MRHVRQESDDYMRRWFFEDNFDLIAFFQPDGLPNGAFGAFQVPVDLALSPNLISEIHQAGYTGVIETQNNTNIFWPLVIDLLPMILFGGWLLFIGVCLTRILNRVAFGSRVT